MTQDEKHIILGELASASKRYAEQTQILQAYMATNPKFPMTTQIYHRTQGEFLALKRLCNMLGIDRSDIFTVLSPDYSESHSLY